MSRPHAYVSVRWLVGALLMAVLPSNLRAQVVPPYAFPPRPTQPSPFSKTRITYGGSIVLDLGNYDVVLRTPDDVPLTAIPGLLGNDAGPFTSDDPVRQQPLPQIIYRSDSGMRWDGRNYFYHPAYPYASVAEFIYRNRVVGHFDEFYPPPQLKQPTVGAPMPPECCPTGRYAFTDPKRLQTPQIEHFGFDLGATVNPFPLPASTEGALSEFCQLYPYAIQCGPLYRGEAGLTPKLVPKSSGTLKVPPSEEADLGGDRSAKVAADRPRLPEPQVVSPEPDQLPIVITNAASEPDACAYTLVAEEREFPFTLLPGQMQQFWADRDWLIRFNSNGMGVKTYRLRGGHTYRFLKDQSGVWELHRQPKSANIMADPPTRLPQAAEPTSITSIRDSRN